MTLRPWPAMASEPVPQADSRRQGRSFLAVRVFAVAFVAAGIAVALWLRSEHSGTWSVDALHNWIDHFPAAPLVFIALLVLRPFLLLPSALLMAAGGALFGVVPGALLSTVGGTLSGLTIFWFARALGREAAERFLGPRLKAAEAFIGGRQVKLVALCTAFPATPLSIAQAACGLSSIRTLPFGLATLIGMLPRTLLLAWFGDALAQAQWLRALVAIALFVLVVFAGLRLRRRFQAQAAAPDPLA